MKPTLNLKQINHRLKDFHELIYELHHPTPNTQYPTLNFKP